MSTPIVDSDALLLRIANHGEQDRVATLLVRGHGKLTVFARQARASQRRFAGGLEPFRRYAVSLQPRPRGMMVLAEAVIRQALLNIPRRLEAMAIASCGVELVRGVAVEGDAQDDLFELLWTFLCGVDGSDELAHALLALRWLEVRVLETQGLFPDLGACLRCAAPVGADGAHFSAATGGVVCADCLSDDDQASAVPELLLRAVHRLYERSLDEVLAGARARSANVALRDFVRDAGRLLWVLLQHLEIELHTYDFLARLGD